MAALWRQGAIAASVHRLFRPEAAIGAASLVSEAVAPYLVGMSDIALSPSAASRVAAIAARQDKPAILRLSVDGGGCAGFQYRFELAETIAADDAIAEEEGVTLVVDPISLDLVRGSTVDFVESLGGAAFQVTNPNAASGCGCGTSFSI
jgi:iron-sulfur cluster assembly accessory protein